MGLRAALLTGLERENPPAVPRGVAGRSHRLTRSYDFGCSSSCFRPGELPADDYVTLGTPDPLPTDGHNRSPPAAVGMCTHRIWNVAGKLGFRMYCEYVSARDTAAKWPPADNLAAN